jgi:hypothetical protein
VRDIFLMYPMLSFIIPSLGYKFSINDFHFFIVFKKRC